MDVLIVLLQSLPFGITVSNVLQILLSALLAGLYYLMYKTQQRQANIQETQNQIIGWQTRLMAAEHQPELVVERVEANGNTLAAEVSNVGEGRARDLKTLCRLYHKKGDRYLTAFSMKALGFVITPVKTPLSRVEKVAVQNMSEVTSIDASASSSAFKDGLDAREEGVLFEGEIKQEIKSTSPIMDVSFTKAIEQMVEEWDAEVVGIDIYLTYTDVIDQEHAVWVESRKEIETEKGMSLEDVLDKGEEIDSPVSTLVPKSSKPNRMREEEQPTP